MIGKPHNDRACLGAITREIQGMVASTDAALVTLAEEHRTPARLARWIRSLPQRDDTGSPCDGPKVEVCRPPQRLRVPAEDPNCVERAALYLGVAELMDPEPVRRLATISTPGGLHTFPTEDGEPVILDPRVTRNGIKAGLFHARQARNCGAPVTLTPTETADWIAELAAEPAGRFHDGARRVRNAHRAMRGVLAGQPMPINAVADVAFTLVLAECEATLYGPAGRRVVHTTAKALDRLDRVATDRWVARNSGRNFGVDLGRFRIPDPKVLGAIGRITGRIGVTVGIEAIKAKLATLGVGGAVLGSVEAELNREGMSLGKLAKPVAMMGSLGALKPESLAGRWLAAKL